MRDMDMEGIYRAKRRDGGGWVEGYFYLDGNKTPCISSFLSDDKSDCTLELEIDPTTLCRHADMKDRNGTPIFENDLIQITGSNQFLDLPPVVCKFGAYLAEFFVYELKHSCKAAH